MLRSAAKASKAQSKAQKKTPVKASKRTLKTTARKTTKRQRAFKPSAPLRNGAPNGWVEGPKGVKRPISPSIQIWKFSPVAYMHVGSRIASAVLAGGMTVAGLYGAFSGSCDLPAALDVIKINAPIVVPILKMAVVLPMTYHGLHGARQIYQDFTAKGYDTEFQEQSSYAIAGTSAAATLYLGLGV